MCGEKTASQDLERFGTAEFTHTHTQSHGRVMLHGFSTLKYVGRTVGENGASQDL